MWNICQGVYLTYRNKWKGWKERQMNTYNYNNICVVKKDACKKNLQKPDSYSSHFWKPKGQKNTNPPLFGKLGLEGMIKWINQTNIYNKM